MVVLDKTLAAPESPDPTWGVEARKLTVKDFSFCIKVLAITAVCALLMFYPPLKEISIADGNLGLLFGVLTGGGIAIAFFSLLAALGKPSEEANIICERKAQEWVGSVLRPYLEKKYGVMFYDDGLFDNFGYPKCKYEGKTIEVKIDGVDVGWNERFVADLGYRTYKISPEGIRLEKVVRPVQISFEPMTPIA